MADRREAPHKVRLVTALIVGSAVLILCLLFRPSHEAHTDVSAERARNRKAARANQAEPKSARVESTVPSPERGPDEKQDLDETARLEAKSEKESPDQARRDFFKAFVTLLNEPAGRVRFCDIPCGDLADFVRRYQLYDHGHFDERDLPSGDQAFELAKLVNQVAFGRSGVALVGMLAVLQDPHTFFAQGIANGSLAYFFTHFSEVLSDFEDRGNQTAIEADDVVRKIKAQAEACSGPSLANIDWAVQCRDLEDKMDSLIAGGALE